MTPAARVQAAIELLEAMTAAQPADQIAGRYFRERRYIGSKDRRAISDIFFGVLRHRARLTWWLQRVGSESETARSRVLAWTALGPEGEKASGLFDGGRYGPAPLSDGERATLSALCGQSIHHPEQAPWVAGEVPVWLYPALHEDLGPDLDAELAALTREAPVDLRVNGLRCDRERARQALAEEGLTAAPTPYSPLGLRLQGRSVLPATRAFRDGWVEVQDEASQIAALLTDARPDMAVADFCAGAGGKTLALAASMANRGRLVALDRDARRLDRARPRLARSGVTCVESHGLAGPDDPWLEEAAGRFDRVLVDAPCSGSGAWRRQPDARWRLASGDLEDLVDLQSRLLVQAAGLVKPGGRLVYATCSLLACENRDRVSRFLEATPDFAQVPVEKTWVAPLDGPCPSDRPDLQLMPARHGTDGFYVAILERRDGR